MTTVSKRSHSLLALLVGGLSVLLLAAGCVAKSAPAITTSSAEARLPAAPAPSSVPRPVASSAATKSVPPDQANSFVPGHRGVGSVLKPDIDRAPVVQGGQGTEEYVAKFYAAVKSTDWRKASTMVPAAEPGEGIEDFKRRQKGYEVGTVSIFPSAMSEGKATAFVVLLTPRQGVWHVTWRFLETPQGIVVKDLTYARPNKSG